MTASRGVSWDALVAELLDLVLPRRCVACRAAGAWLCQECAGRLAPLPAARCRRCGAPLPAAADGCRECRGRGLAFERATAAFCYDGAARALVTACKFRLLPSLAAEMAALAAPAFAVAWAACAAAGAGEPLVTWVPAHGGHRRERGFDLAESLARRLAAGAGLEARPLLRRRREGVRQGGLGREARAENVRDAFGLQEDALRVGRCSRRVMIVDDVYTTGETVNSCAQALALAGLRSHVFTFARAVRAPARAGAAGSVVAKERSR